MSKKIYQFTGLKETNKNILENGYFPVIKLGIQGPEGTKFKLNNGGEISIGRYNIYELDLTNLGGLITSLIFVSDPTGVIVDIVYEGGDS